MYLLNAEVTVRWEIEPIDVAPALADLDVIIEPPTGQKQYLDSPILLVDYVPPTPVDGGYAVYRITPQYVGAWVIRLVIGDETSYEIHSNTAMEVFDRTRSTLASHDDIGKRFPYDISFYLQGYLVPNEIFGVFVATRYVTLYEDSVHNQAVAEAAPIHTNTTFKIFHNDTEVGAIMFVPENKVGLITIQSLTLSPGDKLQVVTQNTALDPYLKDVSVTLVGCCTVVAC